LCGDRELPVMGVAQGEHPAVGHLGGDVLKQVAQRRRGRLAGGGVEDVNALAPLSQRIQRSGVLGGQVHPEVHMP
ncbi:MAG: hypothetical protein ACRENW_03310, partial [Thermodesulfobacteriota bacterium]